MKVRVEFLFEVDRDAWNDEYGEIESPSAIRNQIQWMAYDGLKMGVFRHLIPHVITKIED